MLMTCPIVVTLIFKDLLKRFSANIVQVFVARLTFNLMFDDLYRNTGGNKYIR